MADFNETLISVDERSGNVKVELDVFPIDVLASAHSIGDGSLTYDDAEAILDEAVDEIQDDPEYEAVINQLHAICLKHVASCTAREARYRQK